MAKENLAILVELKHRREVARFGDEEFVGARFATAIHLQQTKQFYNIKIWYGKGACPTGAGAKIPVTVSYRYLGGLKLRSHKVPYYLLQILSKRNRKLSR
ncbi:MAG: hypothetical protein IPL35_17645 [Sphingobacteriales bacterium]|nr:hypothetical protein [Sphingobacteriales bacterium]